MSRGTVSTLETLSRSREGSTFNPLETRVFYQNFTSGGRVFLPVADLKALGVSSTSGSLLRHSTRFKSPQGSHLRTKAVGPGRLRAGVAVSGRE